MLIFKHFHLWYVIRNCGIHMKLVIYYCPEDLLPLYLHILTLHIASLKAYFIDKYLNYDNLPQRTASGVIFLVPAIAHTCINLCLHLCITDLDIFKCQFL